MRNITLKHVTASHGDQPLVEGWAPGLGNVPLDVRMAAIKSQLAGLGLAAAPEQRVRTALLSGPWNGFPRHALVISAGTGATEWFAVSDEPALGAD